MKRAWLWLRAASVLNAVFATGHAFGHFSTPHPGPQQDAVTAMKSFHFNAMGSNRTYWDFFEGYGLLVLVSAILLSVLLWLLSNLARRQPAEARPLLWVLLVTQIVFAIISWTNFFIAPFAVNTLAALCLLVAAFSL